MQAFMKSSMFFSSLLLAGGWNPAIHLYSHSGGKVRWDDGAACFVPGTAVDAQAMVGACRATWTLARTLDDASRAGRPTFAQPVQQLPEAPAEGEIAPLRSGREPYVRPAEGSR